MRPPGPLRHPVLTALLVALVPAACAAPQPAAGAPADRPYAVVLGTAQDGGRPQLACGRACCVAAREDPTARRLVASLAIVDPRPESGGRRWLVDATPDFAEQVALLDGHAGADRHRPGSPGRPALFDAIVLTHAHIGHYLGLAELGREAYGSAPQRVLATPRMASFLRGSGPWSLLVEAGHIALEEVAPGARVALAEDLFVELIPVPHRDEFSDTVAVRIEGPGGSLLWLPDIDKWERWDAVARGPGAGGTLEGELARVDHAFLDATFFGPDELPGRAMSEVPHPFVVETLARLAALPASERAKVRLVHLNHTNPLNEPDSEAAAAVRAAGLHVARRGAVVGL